MLEQHPPPHLRPLQGTWQELCSMFSTTQMNALFCFLFLYTSLLSSYHCSSFLSSAVTSCLKSVPGPDVSLLKTLWVFRCLMSHSNACLLVHKLYLKSKWWNHVVLCNIDSNWYNKSLRRRLIALKLFQHHFGL